MSNPDDRAQTLDCSAVGPTHKQPTIKKGQLVKGFSQQWHGGPQVKSEVKGGSWPSVWGPPFHLAFGQSDSLGTKRTGLGLCFVGLQSPHQGPPLALAQALRQW